jgi:hypothetical protein
MLKKRAVVSKRQELDALFVQNWELAADQDARPRSAPNSRPDAQLGREARSSENIESCKTPVSEEL